jgi:molecular chaperone GrpE (heat shock protein)
LREKENGMARYIDAEQLIRDLIDKDFYPALVKRAIENAPAVSIVLRSELEAKVKQEVAREILYIIDNITGAEYDNHNEVEVAFMRGAKRVREKIIKKYNITEQPITKDRNT